MDIEDINTKIKELNKYKKLLEIEMYVDDTKEDIIFKAYLRVESVTRVAKFMNELGYRLGNRKYIANDISDIITNKDTVIEFKEIKLIVCKIFKSHKRGKRVFL